MPRTLLTVAFFILLTASIYAGAGNYGDIEILSSDESGISFRFSPADPGVYLIENPKDSSAIISKTVLIGIPPGTEPFMASVSGQEPTPYISSTGYTIQSNGGLAVLEGVKTLRGRRIATIRLFPYSFGNVFGRLDVSIEFRKSGSQPVGETEYISDPVFESVFGYSVLNFDRMKSWPSGRKFQALKKESVNWFETDAEWFKILTGQQGLTKVTGQQLYAAGLSLSGLEIDSLHLFYGGGMPLELANELPRPELNEVAIMMFDDGDGIFETNDYFLFFAEKTDRWRYPADSQPVFCKNIYTNTNCYWLGVSGNFTTAGARIQSISGTPSGMSDTTVTKAVFYVREESDQMLYGTESNRYVDWATWYWTTDSPFSFSVHTPNPVSGQLAEITVRARTKAVNLLIIGGFPYTPTYSGYDIFQFTNCLIQSSFNSVSINYDEDFNDKGHLDYLEVAYTGYLEPNSDLLDFTQYGYTGSAEFVIVDEFSETPYIFDLTDYYNPQLVAGASISGGEIRFEADLVSSCNRYLAVTPSKTYNPAGIIEVTPSNLRSDLSQTDMIIVTAGQFASDLDDYIQYREDESNISISTVTIDELMNEFGFGLYDPTAIRDYLKFAYENFPDPKPSAALLVGDGTFDFENILNTSTPIYIPPYVMTAYDSSSSDDNYAYFGEYGLLDGDTSYSVVNPELDRGYDMIIARWPVRNRSELNTIIEKIKSYESSTNYGEWRATVTLVADDEFGSSDVEMYHVAQTETLEKLYLPSKFFRNKIYLWEYQRDSNGDKPEVNREIIRSINDGSLMVNYVGHGNPNTWAHEHVFNRNSDLPQLTNSDRLTLVFVASCSIGFFDDPNREGMAEDLLRLENGGAIATIAASRLVYASENGAFNRQSYEVLFGSDDLSICQAIYAAKLIRQYDGGFPQRKRNDRSYVFFGDPFLKLGVPQYEVEFTDYPDPLMALQQHQVSGRVIDPSTGMTTDFDGNIEVTVYDSELPKKYTIDELSLEYSFAGPKVYHGSTDVTDGLFSFTFIAPLDIGYGGTGARISGYAYSSSIDALGLADSIEVALDVPVVEDDQGPTIEYAFAGRENFVSGDMINSGETLVLTISDPSGINLTGGTGHGISLIIDNQVENTVNLTDLFTYAAGSFTGGEVESVIGELTPGLHKFSIKAWDNANNSTMAEFDAEAVEQGRFLLTDLLNYPNPMHDRTTFSFCLSQSADRVSLEIFTLTGRRIKHYEDISIPPGFHDMYEWDGRDYEQDRVATGTYIYKATASSVVTGDVIEAYGKVVVIN